MPVTLSALSLALERGCLEAAAAGHEADEAGHTLLGIDKRGRRRCVCTVIIRSDSSLSFSTKPLAETDKEIRGDRRPK
jgi:hypothetical protein